MVTHISPLTALLSFGGQDVVCMPIHVQIQISRSTFGTGSIDGRPHVMLPPVAVVLSVDAASMKRAKGLDAVIWTKVYDAEKDTGTEVTRKVESVDSETLLKNYGVTREQASDMFLPIPHTLSSASTGASAGFCFSILCLE